MLIDAIVGVRQRVWWWWYGVKIRTLYGQSRHCSNPSALIGGLSHEVWRFMMVFFCNNSFDVIIIGLIFFMLLMVWIYFLLFIKYNCKIIVWINAILQRNTKQHILQLQNSLWITKYFPIQHIHYFGSFLTCCVNNNN